MLRAKKSIRPRIEKIGCNESQLLHDHCRPEWRAHRLLSVRCSPFWNLKKRAIRLSFFRKSAGNEGEGWSSLVWINMFILFIGKRFDYESCSSKRSLRPFFRALAMLVLGIGSRHWFERIWPVQPIKKKQGRVALVPLSNPLIHSSLKNMLKKRPTLRVCWFKGF